MRGKKVAVRKTIFKKAVEEFNGDVRSWGNKIRVIFDLGNGLKAHFEARCKNALLPRAKFVAYKDATHIWVDTWALNNFHFFGEGARSEKVWEFARNFCGKLSDEIE